MSLNLEPIRTFLTEDTNPKEFAKLLDDFLHDYTTMLIRIQLSDSKDKFIHPQADAFIANLKLLKDILPFCDKEDIKSKE